MRHQHSSGDNGGGKKMKTKVAEAFMYGMPVVGTHEAFTGYEIEKNTVGYCSDNIESYKDYILYLLQNKHLFSEMSKCCRENYENLYSLQHSVEILKKNI